MKRYIVETTGNYEIRIILDYKYDFLKKDIMKDNKKEREKSSKYLPENWRLRSDLLYATGIGGWQKDLKLIENTPEYSIFEIYDEKSKSYIWNIKSTA